MNSILPGYTKKSLRPRSKHGGIERRRTAAAIAANSTLGLVGLGSDTGNSIRGAVVVASVARGDSLDHGTHQSRGRCAAESPRGHCRSDPGAPWKMWLACFQVIVGEDPDDAVTSAAPAHFARRTTRPV